MIATVVKLIKLGKPNVSRARNVSGPFSTVRVVMDVSDNGKVSIEDPSAAVGVTGKVEAAVIVETL